MKVDGNAFRRRRMKLFLSLLGQAHDKPIRILDIGGTPSYWKATEDLWSKWNVTFTIVNLGISPSVDGPFSLVDGNACDLSEYANDSFDIVHSNSVIEHVGHWREMSSMAAEVRRLAPAYYLQTPNYWFPVEPHYRAPLFHWLPESLRAALLNKRRFGFRGPIAAYSDAMANIQSVNLLSSRQLRSLFPDACIIPERFAGLTKSLIAIRRSASR